MPGNIPLDLGPRDPTAQLELELLQERASSLGRMGRDLERALREMAAFDAEHPRAAPLAPDECERRTTLVFTAAQALWRLTIQREACGVRDAGRLIEDYRVPAEVQNMMGAQRPVSGARG